MKKTALLDMVQSTMNGIKMRPYNGPRPMSLSYTKPMEVALRPFAHYSGASVPNIMQDAFIRAVLNHKHL